jgi:protein transport protein SEC24
MMSPYTSLLSLSEVLFASVPKSQFEQYYVLQYTDLATISVLSKYTAGQTYYYPGFNVNRDGAKFERELFRCLTRATGFEAVMRVRATRGS